MPGPIAPFGLSHRPPGSALVAVEAHRHHMQPVDDIGVDLAPGTLHQLLDLLQIRVDDPGSRSPMNGLPPASRMVT